MGVIDQVAATLRRLVDSGELVGFVAGVRESGRSEVVAGGAAAVDGPAVPTDAVFPLSSNSKPLGGILALRLVELGVIGLDGSVAGHLPELADARVLVQPGGRSPRPWRSSRSRRVRTHRRCHRTSTCGGWAHSRGPDSPGRAVKPLVVV